LELGEDYRAKSRAEVDTNQKKLTAFAKVFEKSKTLNKKLRQKWLELHTLGLSQTRKAKVDTIGDEDDYDIALRCLEREVARAGDDVQFLRGIYGRADEEDEEEEGAPGRNTEMFAAGFDDPQNVSGDQNHDEGLNIQQVAREDGDLDVNLSD
jgi:hypothetical protein